MQKGRLVQKSTPLSLVWHLDAFQESLQLPVTIKMYQLTLKSQTHNLFILQSD